MINDYKSYGGFSEPSRQPARRRHLLLAAGALALVVPVVYGFLPGGAQEETKPALEQARESVPTPVKPETIAIALPSSEQTRPNSSNQAEAHPVDRSGPSEATTPALNTPNVAASQMLEAGNSESLSEESARPEPASPKSGSPQAVNKPTAIETDIAAVDEPEITENPTLQPIGRWLQEKVRKGDSLALIFKRLGLSPGLLHEIVNSSKQAAELAHIRPGQLLKVHLDDESQLLELVHERSRITSLHIKRDTDGFQTNLLNKPLEIKKNTAFGTITSSLFEGAKKAGLSDAMTMELAGIFGWDIDFALEIRPGDQFSLIYQEEWLDGKKYRNGPILAAEFVNQGKVFRAIRYVDPEGNANYYSPDGRSMRKAFLRAPVDFRRISSRFTRERWHPVLGKKRPHMGVDYAAATGTPIKASGDGRVIFRGNKGGYGRTMIIRHGAKYTTLYAHMSRFNRKVRNGSRVKQGQVIGYVGQSGLATGPHLHYEFRVNGVHRNPLTVKLPAAAPIKAKLADDFKNKSKPLLAQLNTITKTMVASADTDR